MPQQTLKKAKLPIITQQQWGYKSSWYVQQQHCCTAAAATASPPRKNETATPTSSSCTHHGRLDCKAHARAESTESTAKTRSFVRPTARFPTQHPIIHHLSADGVRIFLRTQKTHSRKYNQLAALAWEATPGPAARRPRHNSHCKPDPVAVEPSQISSVFSRAGTDGDEDPYI